MRKNPLTAKATIADTEEEIKIWLRGAPDRHGGRARRSKKLSSQRSRGRRLLRSRSRSELDRRRTATSRSPNLGRRGGPDGNSATRSLSAGHGSRDGARPRGGGGSRSSGGNSGGRSVSAGRCSRDSSRSGGGGRSPVDNSFRRSLTAGRDGGRSRGAQSPGSNSFRRSVSSKHRSRDMGRFNVTGDGRPPGSNCFRRSVSSRRHSRDGGRSNSTGHGRSPGSNLSRCSVSTRHRSHQSSKSPDVAAAAFHQMTCL